MQKLKIFLSVIFLFFAAHLSAQETYIIEGDTLQLQREVKGPLSLFWTQEGLEYRYFVQKANRMIELRKENNAYKEQLKELTPDAKLRIQDVKFVLYSLRHFANKYNAAVQEDYTFNEATDDIQHRIGLFVGLSNNIYTENPENVLAPMLSLEYEFFDPNLAPRHVAFLQLRHSFKQDEYRYSSTQFSINYRFKALYFSGFDVHIDAELATFLYSEDSVPILNDSGEVTAIKEESGFSFTAPFNFGIGTDIQVTENGFISLSYNDIISIVLDGNGNFPLDFSIGYKYNL